MDSKKPQASTQRSVAASPSTFAAELASSIRSSRKRMGLTQEELADLVGISDRTMRAIEQGKLGVSLGSVLAAAQAVGIHWSVK